MKNLRYTSHCLKKCLLTIYCGKLKNRRIYINILGSACWVLTHPFSSVRLFQNAL